MATTKKTTTRSTTRTPARTPARRKPEQSFVASTESTIKKNPYASAAVATGLISAIAGAAAGFFAWKKSGKSFSEFSGDVATNVKDKADEATTYLKEAASDASTFVKDGVTEAKTKAKEFADRRKDGVDTTLTQSEIAEEALSLKTVGEAGTTFPVDPVIDSQIKTGAVSY